MSELAVVVGSLLPPPSACRSHHCRCRRRAAASGSSYQSQVLPDLLHALRLSEEGLKEFITWKLGTLVSIVRQHVRKYLAELLSLISELRPSCSNLPSINRPVQGSPVLESYDRAYHNMVCVQQLSELEEVIDYCTLPVDNQVADSGRQLICNMWNERIQGAQRSVEVWQTILAVRGLVVPPTEDIGLGLSLPHFVRKVVMLVNLDPH